MTLLPYVGHGGVDVVYEVGLETSVEKERVFTTRLVAVGGASHPFGCPLIHEIVRTPC